MSTPLSWRPVFAGQTLSPCRLIESFVRYNVRPSVAEPAQRPWSEEALATEFEKFGPVKDLIGECVLNLWRLKAFEDKGVKDEEWQKHMGACLVSRYLCEASRILLTIGGQIRYVNLVRLGQAGSLLLVDQYIDFLRATKSLGPTVSVVLEKELDILPQLSKPDTSTSDASVVSKDVEMNEVEPAEAEVATVVSTKPRPVTRARRNASTPARSIIGEDPVPSNEIGSKRGLQSSPSQPSGRSKRARRPTAKAKELKEESAHPELDIVLGLDLALKEVHEDATVDALMVPAVEGVVRLRWTLVLFAENTDSSHRPVSSATAPTLLSHVDLSGHSIASRQLSSV